MSMGLTIISMNNGLLVLEKNVQMTGCTFSGVPRQALASWASLEATPHRWVALLLKPIS